jgi:hypothetical protein
MDHNFVIFDTGLFRDEQPDDELDRRSLGEDCANWLYARLIAIEGLSPGVAPLEEDWGGWTFQIRAHAHGFWIQIWHSFNKRETWILGIEPSSWIIFRKKQVGLAKARLRDAMNSVLASTPEISQMHWVEKQPDA